MADNYSVMNPGNYHLGVPFAFPPIHNRVYNEKYIIKDIKWKTSVLLNRKMYIANVEIKDIDNVVKILSDSIFKSKANKFDTFTLDRRIDVAIGDGEEIIRLATYADRLLQFKQNTLHIINASKNSEFLEATHKYKGVSHHNAVCQFDYGIVWCNAHGVYMYNGQNVTELFIKEGIRSISEDTWDTFYKDKETMIGYVPSSKQVILFKGVNGSGSGDIMIYDMITQSWVKGKARVGIADKTNFVNIWDGRLAWGYEQGNNLITVVPWKVEPSEDVDEYKVQTKEFNFGTQANKKVIKVNITHRGGAAGDGKTYVLPKYAVNGGAFNNSFKDEDGNIIDGLLTYNIPGSSDWVETTLYTDTSVAGKIKSFAIQFTDYDYGVSNPNPNRKVKSDFEINDITIIYRRKSVK